MQQLLSIFQRLKIQTRLVLYYITFAAITVGAVMYFAYTQTTQSLQTTVEDKLSTVAELKENGLSQWLEERQRNAVFLAKLPELQSLSAELLNPKSSVQKQNMARHELMKLLNIIVQRTADFQDIQILDLNGKTVVSMRPEVVGTSQREQPFFIQGLTKTFTQTFHHSDLLGGTVLTLSTPLFDDSREHLFCFRQA